MQDQEAQIRMQEIQRIMERATLYTLLPGAGAVVGGTLVLLGCAASYVLFRAHGVDSVTSLDFASLMSLPIGRQIAFGGLWAAILLVGIAQEAVFAARAARRAGSRALTRPTRLVLFSLTPSIVVAMVLTAKLLGNVDWRVHDVQLIVPLWMMLYGTGIYTAGLFSVRLPRLLGITFIALGAAALLFLPRYGVLTGALSFGLLHVAFGVVVLRRTESRSER